MNEGTRFVVLMSNDVRIHQSLGVVVVVVDSLLVVVDPPPVVVVDPPDPVVVVDPPDPVVVVVEPDEVVVVVSAAATTAVVAMNNAVAHRAINVTRIALFFTTHPRCCCLPVSLCGRLIVPPSRPRGQYQRLRP